MKPLQNAKEREEKNKNRNNNPKVGFNSQERKNKFVF